MRVFPPEAICRNCAHSSENEVLPEHRTCNMLLKKDHILNLVRPGEPREVVVHNEFCCIDFRTRIRDL